MANDGVGNFHATQPTITLAVYPKRLIARPSSQPLLEDAENAEPLPVQSRAAHRSPPVTGVGPARDIYDVLTVS